jgi:hypothetical protein
LLAATNKGHEKCQAMEAVSGLISHKRFNKHEARVQTLGHYFQLKTTYHYDKR